MCPTLAIYRKLEKAGELPPQLKSEALATGQVSLGDLRLLLYAGQYRVVLADHLAALLERNPKSVHRVILKLYHHGYLARFIRLKRLRTGLDHGSEKLGHGLDRRGFQALEARRLELEQELGRKITRIHWRKDHTRRGEIFIEHTVAVSTVRAAVELAIRQRPDLELVEWRQDDKLRHSFTYRDPETGEPVKASVRPDAYFAVHDGRQRRNFFLELDNGSKDHTVLQEQMQRLLNYTRSSRYQKRYQDRSPENIRILFVCKDAGKATISLKRGETEPMTRFDRMFLTLELIRGKRDRLRRLFWFTRFDAIDLTEPGRILKPIWRRRGMKEGEGHSLFGPVSP